MGQIRSVQKEDGRWLAGVRLLLVCLFVYVVDGRLISWVIVRPARACCSLFSMCVYLELALLLPITSGVAEPSFSPISNFLLFRYDEGRHQQHIS